MANRQPELRILAVVKLYELGLLSSGRAAELAGIGRVELLLSLPRYKVFPFEAELRDRICLPSRVLVP
jgi:predicted HTH domain antitoxin